MNTHAAFQATFKAHLLRRLGSWGSRLSADDIESILGWVCRVIPHPQVRSYA